MPSAASAFTAELCRRIAGWGRVAVLASAGTAATLLAQEPLFRSSVDVIAVDVQVLDRDGNPVDALPADVFEVSIKGQRRKVLSAEFVRHSLAGLSSTAIPGPAAAPETPVSSLSSLRSTSRGGRTMVLAIDIGSFDPGAERAPMEAAKEFVASLEPTDMVGLFVFPDGVWIPPTVNRAALRARLDRLVGMHQPLRSYYNLKPWEIVEITTESTNPNSFLTNARRGTPALDPAVSQQLDVVMRIQQRECPGDSDCPILIYNEGIGLATQLERQAQLSLGGLESLLHELRSVEGRKSVVLLSGGILVSDRPEGRPDAGDLARILGQEAARAHAVVYTIHVDVNTVSSGASTGRRAGTSDNIGRDRALYGTWLEQFSDAAGGDRIYVPTGQGNFAFQRVLRESSGYYLLGVEPASADRDGQARELKVKVNAKARNLTVRSRQWVVVPPRSQSTAAATSGAPMLTR